jgi:hypothetical protein
MARANRPGAATLGQRPAPSLIRTMEALRALGGRAGARAEALDREAKFTISPGTTKR